MTRIKEKAEPFWSIGGALCISLILAIMFFNAFPDTWNPLARSSALSQTYYIWHDHTGYYVIAGNGQGRYPLKTTLLNVTYGCYKFEASADIFTKTISLNLTSEQTFFCVPPQQGGRN